MLVFQKHLRYVGIGFEAFAVTEFSEVFVDQSFENGGIPTFQTLSVPPPSGLM
jgi:hypothetical protein